MVFETPIGRGSVGCRVGFAVGCGRIERDREGETMRLPGLKRCCLNETGRVVLQRSCRMVESGGWVQCNKERMPHVARKNWRGKRTGMVWFGSVWSLWFGLFVYDQGSAGCPSRPGSRPRLMRIGLRVYGDDGTEYWLAAAWSAEGGR